MKEFGVYRQLVYLPYLTAYKKTIEAAVSLDIFSGLIEWKTAGALAEENGWQRENTGNLLDALASIGFAEREGEAFRASEEARKYLVKESPYYMGNTVLFFGANPAMDPGDVAKQVMEGGILPDQRQQMEEAIDFSAYGEMMRQAQSGVRIREVLDLVRSLPEHDSFTSLLDLGCGAGMIGLAILADDPKRRMTFYDVPFMEGLIRESIEKAGKEECTEIRTGDFLKDDLGSGYDMILASSVISFALQDLDGFMKKLYEALNPGGLVLCINEGLETDSSGPWEMVFGFLPMKLQGIPVGVPKGIVKQAAGSAGFSVEMFSMLLSTGTQEINILRKP